MTKSSPGILEALFEDRKKSAASKKGGARKRCEGHALNGQACRRLAQKDRLYCAAHDDRSGEIGLPPYASCNAGRTKLWIYHGIGPPRWVVGNRGPSGGQLVFRSLSTGAEYSLLKFVAEGSYGAVYDCALQVSAQPTRRVAVKACKGTFNSRRLRGAMDVEMMEDDYLREYFIMRVAHDRLSTTAAGDDVAAEVVEAFLVKTTRGLHGCLAMELMDGNLGDLFEALESRNMKNCGETLRFWALCCRDLARMMRRLHEVGVYHLDAKPANVLYKRTRGKARGFVLRLVDFGLGGYLPRPIEYGASEPLMECRATGTYLPPEWRRNGDKRRPTFARLTSHAQLEVGEAYALCKSCHKMRQCLHSTVRDGPLAKKLPAVVALYAALDAGRRDGDAAATRVAGCGGVRGVEATADAAVRELDAAMSSDGDDEMAACRFPFASGKN